ncbi:hypothetical protein OC834_002122 [Tilletia horrida]|uniref:Uncharacterized protein n=1 Tax=Tilletia horrida TaxID=155126 RepID=A0AAN6GHQ1_9BASI|nr:hypothetical protein OC835_003911 [Tilletia horrida]KAK0533709.1 hypothetical protein OC834_002122 [Tilletia horrida]KAK0540671.1 hypothetical protein OC842_000346 [Tilletia horrida]KAK0566099.1 hypothetical protein OC844_000911 [Tilletia horrida]
MPSTYLSCCPRSLTHPAGITFLDHRQRVSRVELEKRDARWRALRERAYARHWADDATLVGSMRSYGDSGSMHYRSSRAGGINGRARPRRLTIAAWKKLLDALRNE